MGRFQTQRKHHTASTCYITGVFSCLSLDVSPPISDRIDAVTTMPLLRSRVTDFAKNSGHGVQI